MSIPPVTVGHSVAFEGQARYVTDLTSPGVDFSGASVRVEDPASGLTLVEQACNPARCAVVASIADTRPNRGVPIPAPIDAARAFLRVTTADGTEYRGLVNVSPLDTISNGGTTPLMLRGTVLASSASASAGSTFVAADVGDPVRWIIFGGGALHGAIDVSAQAGSGRAGGFTGGEPGLAGPGPSGGEPGLDGAGGGGGGGVEPGEPGAAADGTAGGGGAGGAGGGDGACAVDFEAGQCGGGGGGGGGGRGGGGGGTLLVVSLGALDLGGAALSARGGEGADGGGGGGGGHVVVAAPSWTAPASIDVTGGGGSGGGGGGGAGLARVHVPGSSFEGATGGIAVEVAAIPPIDRSGSIVITGSTEPDATVDVRALGEGAPRASATADAAGAFSATVDLVPGLNRLVVESTGARGRMVSFSGSSLDFERVGTMTFPVSAVIDVVHLPASE